MLSAPKQLSPAFPGGFYVTSIWLPPEVLGFSYILYNIRKDSWLTMGELISGFGQVQADYGIKTYFWAANLKL